MSRRSGHSAHRLALVVALGAGAGAGAGAGPGAATAHAATSCGYTPFTASTSILVKKSRSITCRTAKIKMRAYLKSGSAPRGWRCNNNRSDYYLCAQRNGNGRAYGRLDTTSGE